MGTRTLIVIIIGAGLAAIVATVVLKLLGTDATGVFSAAIGGGVGGAVAAVIAARHASTKK